VDAVDERIATGGRRFVTDGVHFTPLSVSDTIQPQDPAGRTAGQWLAGLIGEKGIGLQPTDVVVVSSKVVSFFEGGLIRLDSVTPSRKARILGRAFKKDPRKVQLIMETGNVLLVVPMHRLIRIPRFRRMMEGRSADPEAMVKGFRRINNYAFVVGAHAAYLDEAGIDYTNSPDGFVTVLPRDPCAVAARIRAELRDLLGASVAVLITDSVTCVGRVGSQDIAIGYAGIDPVMRLTFSRDLFGVPRSGGIDVVIDSIAGMAGLIMGQTTERIPAVLVRGVSYLPEREQDDARGMEVLGYPKGAQWWMLLLALLATLRFRLVSLLAFQRWPKRERR
jgi:coenzyme F420-0:L-glutamate ligase/coenzyme F420-1:gamma-L-glutamate ligase